DSSFGILKDNSLFRIDVQASRNPDEQIWRGFRVLDHKAIPYRIEQVNDLQTLEHITRVAAGGTNRRFQASSARIDQKLAYIRQRMVWRNGFKIRFVVVVFALHPDLCSGFINGLAFEQQI